MPNMLLKATSRLFEKMFMRSEVLDVRAWEPATIYEVDVHIPSASMEKWDSIKRLKCKVDEFEYRDYTPAYWNAEKKICTMFIEAGHNGAGSRWIRQLKTGDEILLGAAHAAPLPVREGKILCLADGSALGHFLGLKQLTDRQMNPLEVGVFLHDYYQIPPNMVRKNPEFEFIAKPEATAAGALDEWMIQKSLSDYTSIYIAGNIPMVTALRKKLRMMPGVQAKIYAHGFWS